MSPATTAEAGSAPHRTFAWTALVVATSIATIAPLFAAKFLPFCDLPEHVATIAALRHWNDPAFSVSETYVFAAGRSQYLLYHLVGAGLAYVVGTAERANLILLAASGLAYPLGLRSLLRALRRDERLCLFACPLFWSQALMVGLLPFVAAVPLVFYGLGAAVVQARHPTRRRFVLLALGTIAVFFVHVMAFTVLVLVAFALTLALSRKASRAAWAIPSVAVACVWALHARVGLHGGSLREAGQLGYASAAEIGAAFPLWLHDVWPSHLDEAMGIVFWTLLGVIAIDGARLRGKKSAGDASCPRWTLWIPFVCTAVLFVAVPYRVGGGDMINFRLAPFLPMFLLLTLEPPPGLRGAIPLVAASALSLVVSWGDLRGVRRAQEELGDFDRVLAAMTPGSRVVSLQFRRRLTATHMPAWIHVVAYHRARTGGIAEPSFGRLGHWPVQFRADAVPPAKPTEFWESEPCAYRNTIDGPYYDHVLIRGDRSAFEGAPGPVWRLVLREGEWMLYAKVPGAWNDGGTAPDVGPCPWRRGSSSDQRLPASD